MVPINNSPEGEGNFLKALIYCQQKRSLWGNAGQILNLHFMVHFHWQCHQSWATKPIICWKRSDLTEIYIFRLLLASCHRQIRQHLCHRCRFQKNQNKHKWLRNASNEIILLRGRLPSYSCKGFLYRLTVDIHPFSVQPINVYLAWSNLIGLISLN